MKNNLLWRFVIIFLVTAIAGWIAWSYPQRLGIDLAGGVSQVYELDTSKLKGSSLNTSDIATQVVEVLKRRIDPKGVKNIIWRVVGGKRIQIQMPLADKSTREARDAQQAALEDLINSVPKPAEITAAISQPKSQREAILEKWAPKGSAQYEDLLKLADANDRLTKARDAKAKFEPPNTPPEPVLKENFEAQRAYDDQLQKVKSASVNITQLQTLAAAADAENTKAQADLVKFADDFPLQKTKILKFIEAHKKLMALSGGGIDDPNELQRLITRAGVLDFRIAVTTRDMAPTSTDYTDAIQSLDKHGPDQQVTVNGVKARWFMIDANSHDNFRSPDYIMHAWADEPYLLCYDDTGKGSHTLTHNDPTKKPWSVSASNPQTEPSQGLVLPFTLDPIGASYMGDLTSSYIQHPMAILLDDHAITAPNIHSEITSSGEITFGIPGPGRPGTAIQKEAEQLKQIMDAGSLPATLRPEPISVENISPDMGADNIAAGVRSAYIAVGAVVAFMCLYYTITGVFADLALMLNLLLVMASMVTFRATWTLPGIAGLVLTLGMAVDANVLINERIREEIHRGASLWMAIKQGYDKVFWTIFDANLTCSLTSIVLIYVGSEEVKGFGVTLLIGLIIHMFTALFVTRTLMMAFVKWGIVRAIDDHSLAEYLREIVTFTWLRNGHWPFMRVITVTNFDWIGKRHIFWGVSAVVILAGIVTFAARGDEKYDIEFRGGTQISLQLSKPGPDGKYLELDQVREKIKSLASLSGLRELDDVRVYSVGDPADHRFEMQTTIANKSQNFEETLPGPFKKQFGALLDTSSLHIEHDSSRTLVDFKASPQGQTLTADDVRNQIHELAKTPALADLVNADVAIVGKAQDHAFQVIIPNLSIKQILEQPLAEKFKEYLHTTPSVSIRGAPAADPNSALRDVRELMDQGIVAPITSNSLDQVFARTGTVQGIPPEDVSSYKDGVAVLLDNITPPQSADELTRRIKATQASPEFQDEPSLQFKIIPVAGTGNAGAAPDNHTLLTRAVLVASDPAHPYEETNETLVNLWRTRVASPIWKVITASLSHEQLFDGVTSFDAVVANEAKVRALAAIVISLALIVVYVWVRFGGIRYGIGAILSLVHDAIVAVAATVLSGLAYNHLFNHNSFLLITDFKINLTMIAAYLTIIGYSVNDTIVIFDRVRELRGKSHAALTPKLINDAINQCFGRTIWTTFTVFIVVLIMYIWGGEGVRGFSFAMLIGVITGAYSTLAIASPMLLTTGSGGPTRPTGGENPFMRKEQFAKPPSLPQTTA